MQKLYFWVPLREPKWHTPACPSIRLPPKFGPQFQYSSAGIAKVLAIWQKRVGPKPNVLSVGRATITKDALTERKSNQNAPTVKGYMLLLTKGVQRTKNKHLDNMWWTIKSHMLPFYIKTRLPLSPRIRHSHFQPNSL